MRLTEGDIERWLTPSRALIECILENTCRNGRKECAREKKMRSIRGTLVGLNLGVVLCFFGTQDLYAFKIVSFDGQFTRWNSNQIHYVVDERGSDNFVDGCDESGPCVSIRTAIQRSFQSWTEVSGTNLSFIEDTPERFSQTGYDGRNTLIWTESGWTSLPFAPPTQALAVTISTYKTSNMEIVDSDIHFNGEFFDWAVIDTEEEQYGNFIDVQNIATHEIGHFVGLDHSSENVWEDVPDLYLATMFFASGPGETFRRDLDTDDRQALAQIYPSYNRERPEVFEVFPSNLDTSMSTSATVTVSGDALGENAAVLLAVPGDAGDVAGRVLSATEQELIVSFDLYGVSSGSYDVVVSNAYNQMTRLAGAINIEGSSYSSSYGDYGSSESFSSSTGGCSVSGNEKASPWNVLVTMCLPLFLIGMARRELIAKKVKKD